MRQALAREKVRGIYDTIAKRYDWLHGSLTAHSDQRGRKLVVGKTIRPGNQILDTGAGTGSTSILAARRTGKAGHVVLLDLSEGMLEEAKRKATALGLEESMSFQKGDMEALPFEDATFDAVVSTYSVCPLTDPAKGALEAYRVLKPGGLAGFAHSVEPANRLLRKLADWVESLVWLAPMISMGCRAVTIQPALMEAGARVVYEKRIGVPLWPFVVFVVQKPE